MRFMVESFNVVEVFNGDSVNTIARLNGRCKALDHVDEIKRMRLRLCAPPLRSACKDRHQEREVT